MHDFPIMIALGLLASATFALYKIAAFLESIRDHLAAGKPDDDLLSRVHKATSGIRQRPD